MSVRVVAAMSPKRRRLGIELPYAAAERAWGFLTYGTLVTVLP